MNKVSIYVLLFSSVLASCATYGGIGDAKRNNQMVELPLPIIETKAINFTQSLTVPEDVCWFDGEAFKVSGIKCQYRDDKRSFATQKYPFQCIHEEGETKWRNISNQVCE